MQMFHDLHRGDIPLFSLNFGVIKLLPKTQDASKINQYRPICLLNVSFKCFMKVATIRVNSVAGLGFLGAPSSVYIAPYVGCLGPHLGCPLLGLNGPLVHLSPV